MRRIRAGTAAVVVAATLAACSGRGRPNSTASPTGTTTIASPAGALPAPPAVRLELLARVPLAVCLAVRRGDPALYVVGRNGKVWAIRDGRVDPTPVLDVSSLTTTDGELGLLGMTFSPDGRFAYVNYTDRHRDTNIVEYAWRNGRADMASARRLLLVPQRFLNHKGGDLAFGPDGDLYIGLGDGGSNGRFGDPQGDPFRNGQNLDVLLGKMLRIEPRTPDGSLPPNGAPYLIPKGNPFAGRAGARPEIWAYGLRNPWRFSFDRRTGDLWIADVGAGAREEIDMQPAGAPGGRNYGWNAVEGTFDWRSPPPNAVGPVYEYRHLPTGGPCAIVGGFVYRGAAIPGLDGWYVYGDYCTGEIDALRFVNGTPDVGRIAPELTGLVSFGQDQRGELYALSLSRGVYRIVP